MCLLRTIVTGCGGPATSFMGLGREAAWCGVPPCYGSLAALGVVGTGEQVQNLGALLGDETHLGECLHPIS